MLSVKQGRLPQVCVRHFSNPCGNPCICGDYKPLQLDHTIP